MNLRRIDWFVLRQVAAQQRYIMGRGMRPTYRRLFLRGLVESNEVYTLSITTRGEEVLRSFVPPKHWTERGPGRWTPR